VPDKIFGLRFSSILSTAATRSGRLTPPPAALPSLPKLSHIRECCAILQPMVIITEKRIQVKRRFAEPWMFTVRQTQHIFMLPVYCKCTVLLPPAEFPKRRKVPSESGALRPS